MAVLKHLIALGVVVGAFAAHSQVSTSTKVEPGKLSAQKRFLFLVDAAKTNNLIRYSVTVAPNARNGVNPNYGLTLFTPFGVLLRAAI